MTVGPKATVSVKINFTASESLSRASEARGVRYATFEAENILVDLLSQPGQGAVYSRGKKTHRASAPGDPPAVDTGNLRRNREKEFFETADGFVGTLILNSEYAEALEIGTEKIAPRPSIGTIPVNHSGRIQEAFAKGAKID